MCHRLPPVLAALLLILSACDSRDAASPPQQTVPAAQPVTAAPDAGFADNRQCLRCHRQQAGRWAGSHHALAMAVASEDSVLGDFNDQTFTHQGVSSRFFRRAGQYFVNTEGRDGQRQDFEVSYTFGVQPLQQYLVAFPDGRLQALTVAWDSRTREQGGQRWFQLQPDTVAPPGDPLHWTGRMYNWNTRCAECHSTNLKKNYDPQTDSYETTWSEVNVSCQSCHGPGAAHVEWAQNGSDAQAEPDYSLVNAAIREHPQALVDSCARCHSRRHPISPDDAHGRALLDDFEPATLEPGLYYPGGQIQDEVYVYGSFLQSKMYRHGVSCIDCHDAHSTGLKKDGNALCLQCHNTAPPARFPSLQQKDYDTPAHHFHAAGSAGAECVNCHMPATTYMSIDPRRDHSLRIPRPDLSVSLGVPNACNQCHADQSPQWAAEHTADWYGTALRDTPHYGEIIAAARNGDAAAYEDLVALANDKAQAGIVTATALQLLTRYGPRPVTADTLRAAVTHPDPLVRTVATSTLGLLPEVADLNMLTGQLTDPVRAVRIEAARILAPIPRQHLDAGQISALDAALLEYRDTQVALADMPEALLNLAVLDASLGDVDAAVAQYRKAIRLAPEFVPARVNLANLYNRSGRNPEAEQQLRAALTFEPQAGELYYSLGLLLVEERRLTEAAVLLQQASERLPQRARVHYNYALLLQRLNRMDEAQPVLERALALQPENTDTLYALVVLHTQQQHWDDALNYVRQLQSLEPDNADTARLLQQLQRAAGASAAD